ncbi:tryptophan synthase alpha chain [Striga asiatica]|uniref:Tryptophan synthase alpha chain n=1 Tax=Striga asiatica TaxID=4170 RepID=A0A5A7R1F4_STRAF|nr:tryptophan synthase alpha chain [Striga asiatica]
MEVQRLPVIAKECSRHDGDSLQWRRGVTGFLFAAWEESRLWHRGVGALAGSLPVRGEAAKLLLAHGRGGFERGWVTAARLPDDAARLPEEKLLVGKSRSQVFTSPGSRAARRTNKSRRNSLQGIVGDRCTSCCEKGSPAVVDCSQKHNPAGSCRPPEFRTEEDGEMKKSCSRTNDEIATMMTTRTPNTKIRNEQPFEKLLQPLFDLRKSNKSRYRQILLSSASDGEAHLDRLCASISFRTMLSYDASYSDATAEAQDPLLKRPKTERSYNFFYDVMLPPFHSQLLSLQSPSKPRRNPQTLDL